MRHSAPRPWLTRVVRMAQSKTTDGTRYAAAAGLKPSEERLWRGGPGGM
jgi:hypothetical protein